MNFHHILTSLVSRRQWLQSSALASWSLSMGSTLGAPISAASPLRFGLITDVHYADKAPAGTRHYRESIAKLEEAAAAFEQAQVAFVVELGHSHENALNQIGGIPYCTLVAMVEGSGPEQSGYAVVEVTPAPTLALQGFRRQTTQRW